MTIAQNLASEYGLRISDDDGATWLTASGLTSLTFDETPADIDITTFDSDGWSSTMPGIKTGVVNATGYRLSDSVTGVRDSGQKAIEKAARAKGFASRRKYRIVWLTAPTTNYIEFNGYAKNGQFGGGLNAATPWGVTIGLDGEPTFAGEMFDTDD